MRRHETTADSHSPSKTEVESLRERIALLEARVAELMHQVGARALSDVNTQNAEKDARLADYGAVQSAQQVAIVASFHHETQQLLADVSTAQLQDSGDFESVGDDTLSGTALLSRWDHINPGTLNRHIPLAGTSTVKAPQSDSISDGQSLQSNGVITGNIDVQHHHRRAVISIDGDHVCHYPQYMQHNDEAANAREESASLNSVGHHSPLATGTGANDSPTGPRQMRRARNRRQLPRRVCATAERTVQGVLRCFLRHVHAVARLCWLLE